MLLVYMIMMCYINPTVLDTLFSATRMLENSPTNGAGMKSEVILQLYFKWYVPIIFHLYYTSVVDTLNDVSKLLLQENNACESYDILW